MKILEKRSPGVYTVIIGCGRLGANIANALSNDGENVLIIDECRDAFRRLSSSFGGLSVVGNGTDLDVLKEAQISRADAVIAVTNDDNTNIMAAQIARDLFQAKKVIARLYDSEREAVYRQLGINTICPAVLSVKEIDKMLDDVSLREVQ